LDRYFDSDKTKMAEAAAMLDEMEGRATGVSEVTGGTSPFTGNTVYDWNKVVNPNKHK
jgi:hypothetical protein